MTRPRIVVESPYRGDTQDPQIWQRNVNYAMACMIDSLHKGEAPFLSHCLYPMVLNDQVPEQRAIGLEAAQAWIGGAQALVAYVDHGESEGMKAAIRVAESLKVPVYRRRLYGA